MSWVLLPGTASGPVQLGASRDEVHRVLGPLPAGSTADAGSDRYPDVHVHYDRTERCVAVEVWPELQPALGDVAVLAEPYVATVRQLRATDPVLLVHGEGAVSLTGGIGVAAPGGVRQPFAPADSVIVFCAGYYGDLFDRAGSPAAIAVRDLSFLELSALLEARGWVTTILTSTAPLVAGEPELAVFRRHGDEVRATFDPVVELRVLELQRCGAGSAAELRGCVPAWADVDSAAALADPGGIEEVVWGLTLAAALASPRLEEHVERYVDDPHPLVAEAARRALEASSR